MGVLALGTRLATLCWQPLDLGVLMTNWHKLGLASTATLIALSVFAGCGGRSNEDPSTGGNAGAGAGGAAAGQGGSAGTPGSGGAGAGGGKCWYDGSWYGAGESLPSASECATCTCFSGVNCTWVACPNVCPTIQNEYHQALEEAKLCDPAFSVEQCRIAVAGDLNCRCPTHVNSKNTQAHQELDKLLNSYEANQCGGDIICGACLPTSGYCSPEGRCEDLVQGGGASCLVNGNVYPDGAFGIKDPFSCNSCTCNGGVLGCTEIFCDQPCPPNSAPGQRCARCGPTDGCELIETACLPLCSDTCERPGDACVNGVCQGRCG